MPDTDEMCSRVLERFLAASSGLCRLPVGNEAGFACSLGRSRAGLLLCAGQEQLSYSHQPQGGGQHHTDPRKEGSTVLTAEWPIAGLIPLGVENVTPRSTKPLALQRQLSTCRSLPQLSTGVFMRWGIPGSFCSSLPFSNQGSPLPRHEPSFHVHVCALGLLLLHLAGRVESPGLPSPQ